MIAAVVGFALRATFLAGLLYAVVLSGYILWAYARKALSGNAESRWLGRHITAIAASHLLLLSWVTARFMAHAHSWSWPWIVALGLILTLSDYGIWQIYRYRRWRERRAAKE